MKRLVAVSVAVFLALSVVAIAGSNDGASDRSIVGTVSHVDTAAKSMSVKDSGGKDVTVYWNDATRLDNGLPQEGSTVTVTLDGKDQGSTPMAKSIAVQQPKKPY
jgi:hypothetical protein